ncbi:hypothetical protein VCRA2113O415_300048 [Vibrio crassostreae]|nr:hypothetical protein VCRA2113O415_300048 [Vibrio crassostreae]CAK2783742.1 hypothetical protein VCRA2113O420_310007 [Vibrio crassostreae]CAK3393030.1 hypothetical protein VCRA2121O436_310007 [Vibrio crassostreae]
MFCVYTAMYAMKLLFFKDWWVILAHLSSLLAKHGTDFAVQSDLWGNYNHKLHP